MIFTLADFCKEYMFEGPIVRGDTRELVDPRLAIKILRYDINSGSFEGEAEDSSELISSLSGKIKGLSDTQAKIRMERNTPESSKYTTINGIFVKRETNIVLTGNYKKSGIRHDFELVSTERPNFPQRWRYRVSVVRFPERSS